jgi:hypothetical protein
MRILNGSYAPVRLHTRRDRMRHRWFWARQGACSLYARLKGAFGDGAGGYLTYREWGRWVLRPTNGWRRIRYVTPPAYSNNTVAADDRDSALLSFGEYLGY